MALLMGGAAGASILFAMPRTKPRDFPTFSIGEIAGNNPQILFERNKRNGDYHGGPAARALDFYNLDLLDNTGRVIRSGSRAPLPIAGAASVRVYNDRIIPGKPR